MSRKIFTKKTILKITFIIFANLFFVNYPVFALVSGQDASLELGQEDFTGDLSNRGGSPDANTLWLEGEGPSGKVSSDGTRLFVADAGNNRILIWNTLPTTNGQPANVVLGQSNFTTRDSGVTENSLYDPRSAFSDGTHLFVADTRNNRILIWNHIPTENNHPADLVLGQTNFTNNSENGGGTGDTDISYPYAVFSDGIRLFVGDTQNNRIVIWNHIPTENNHPADMVLGQANFSDRVSNRGGSVSADTLYYPRGVYFDGTRLFVADTFNQRILIWSTLPTENGESADVAVGQENLNSDSYPTGGVPSEYSLGGPWDVFSDGTKLFVTDTDFNRVLVWNLIPTESNTPADIVLGQDDFSTNVWDAAINRMSMPNGIFGGTTTLYVADGANDRILAFNNAVIDRSDSSDTHDESRTFTKDTRCLYTKPGEITWINFDYSPLNSKQGLILSWTQYGATKINIKIDDGTGNYPWMVSTINDGHEFLPNVAPWQNIKIQAINHCKFGDYSLPVSYSSYPNGWYSD